MRQKLEPRIYTDAADQYGKSVKIRRLRENPRFLLVAETMINAEDRRSRVERMMRSSILGPRSSTLNPLSSIFYMVYYIGGSAAQTWAGNYLTNNGDRMGLKLALPRKK